MGTLKIRAEEMILRSIIDAGLPPEPGDFVAHGLASFVECPLPADSRPSPPASSAKGD